MAKQLNVNLAFTADTSQTKSQLQDLQNALNKVINQPATGVGNKISKEIQEASYAAAELKVHLERATNVDTGNLDFTKLNQSLKESGKTLSDYALQIRDIGPTGEKAFLQLMKSVANAEVPIKRTSKKLDELFTTLKNSARWEISSKFLHSFESAISSAYGYAQDLNKSLSNIRIVSGQSSEQMAQFAEYANKAAKALSTTTLDYTDASLIYYQQGLTDKEVQERTEVTIKMANAAGESTTKVSDQLTAVWNNFYDGSKSLEYYADVMTKLGAATASSTDEIAQGLEKFAAVSDTIGLSYEYATAALATVTSNTRESADVVGTAFKTIFSRMQDLDLGETLDDGTTLGQYAEALDKVGINVLDANGNLIEMDKILDQMAAKWETLSKAQQVSLAQSVAGVRQYNQLVALMDNWNAGDADSMVANLGYVSGAEGSLQEQADIYAESWEAANDRMQASFESLWNKLIDDEAFIDLFDLIGNITDGVGYLIDRLGGLKGVLTTVGSVLMQVFSKQISSSISTIGYNIQNFIDGGVSVRKAHLQEMQKMLQDVEDRDDIGSAENNAMKIALQEQIKVQSELIDKAKSLSTIEKDTKEQLIEQLKVRGELAAKTGAQLDEAKEKSYNAKIKSKVYNINTESQDYINLMNQSSKIGKAQGSKKNNNISIEQERKTLEELVTKYVTTNKLSKEAKQAVLEELKARQELSKAEAEHAAAMQNLTQSREKDNQESQESADNAEREAVGRKKAGEAAQQEAQKKKQVTQAERENKQVTEQSNQAQEKNTQSRQENKEKIDKQTESLKNNTNAHKENTNSFKLTSQSFVEFGTVAMSSLSALSMFSAGLDSLKNLDSEASFGDVASGLLSMSGGAIQAGSALSKLSKISVTTSGTTLGAVASTGKLGGAFASLAGEAGAAGGALGGVLALLPYIAIAAVAVGLAIYGIKEAYNSSSKGQLKQTEAAVEGLKDVVQETSEEAEKLKSVIESYDSAVDKLKECERGTKEWKEALLDANNAAVEVINSMDNLSSDEIKNLYHRNSDGLIELDETALSSYQDQLNQTELSANYAQAIGDYQLVERQNDVSMDKLTSNIYNHTAQYNSNTGDVEYQVWDEIRENLVDHLDELSESMPLDEFKDKLEKAGIEITSFSDKDLASWQSSLQEMANAADSANEKLKLIAQIKADEILGDEYSAEEKTYAANENAKFTKERAAQYKKMLESDWDDNIVIDGKKMAVGINRASSSNNEVYQYTLDRLKEAGYDVSAQTSNAVRGTDTNRSLAFLDSNGKEVVYNSTQISKMLAAADALDKMGESAEKAKNLLLQFEGEQVEVASNIINNFDQDKQEFDLDAVTADLSKENLLKILDRSSGTLTEAEAAEALGISTEQLQSILSTLGVDFTAFSSELTQSANATNEALLTIGDDLSKTPKKIFDSFEDKGTWNSLGANAKENVSALFQEVFNDFGSSGLTQLEDIFNILGDESDEFANILDDIDWDTVTISEFNDLMDDAGIETDLESDALDLLIQAMKEAETATDDLTAAQKKYSSYQEIGNMEMGDTISQDQMDSLVADNPILSEYFTPMADGTYMLTEKVEYFKGIVEDLSFKNLKDQLDLALETSANYGKAAEFDYNKLAASEVSGQDQYDYLTAAGYSDATKMAEWNEALLSGTATDSDFNEMAEAIKECGDQTEYFKTKASELAEEANKIDESIQFSDYVDRVSDYGLDFEITERYAKDLQAEMEATSANYDNVQLAARNLAIANQRLDRGIKSLSDNSEDYTKKLAKENRYTAEYSEALRDLKGDIADIFNASSDLISDEFIEEKIIGDPDTMQALANGNMEVINNMRMEIAANQYETALRINTEVDDTQIDAWVAEFNELVANIPDLTIGVDGNIEGENEFITSLNGLIANAGMTRDQVNAMLGSMGMSAKLVTNYEDQEVEVPVYTKVAEITPGETIELEGGTKVQGYTEKSYTVQTGTQPVTGKVPVTAIETIAADGTSSGGGIDLIGDSPATTGGSSSGWSGITSKPSGSVTGGGSGGGGSSSSSKPAEKKKESDVLDRYKEITDALDDVTRATEKASKAADRLYGKSRIDAMKQANASLQQEISLLKQKKSEAESYLNIDRQALDAVASAAGVSFSYDAEGNISNYTSQMQALLNQYNALVDQVNADGDVSEEEQEKLDTLSDLIDKLKEAISQYDDTKELLQDLDEQITDKFYEWQDNNYEILHYELEIEIELNDLQLEYIDYYLNKIEDDFYSMAEAAQYMTSQIPLMTDSLGDYENFYNKITQAYANGEISQADYVDGMKEAYSSILDQLQALNELDKEMMHYYEDTLDAASKELSKYTDRMEHLTSVLGHYKNLIELINGEYDYESIGKILDGQAKTLKNELDVLTANYKMLLTEKEAIEQSLANAQDDAARELFQEELDAINAAVDEAQENMLAKTEEWAEAQKAIMENAMAEAAAEMEKAFTDGMGFDALSNSLSRLSSYADEYLTKTNQMYETQKLINTAQQAADKSTNEAAKVRLKAYTDEIEQLQNKNQLSNLELEIAKAKYDVVLAEIALEEAQNAKSTVRLQRDSEGNFGYVYTSDQEQISQAEQDLADAQNALYNIGLEGANEYGQKLLELKQQLADELVALEEARAAGQYATDEEYYAARDQLIQEYNDLFLAYSEQYTTALGVDTAIQEEAWVNAYENMINKTGDWQEKTQLYTEKCEEAFESWRDVVETESEVVDAILNDLESEVDDVTEASDDLKNEVVNQVIPAMNNQLISVRNVTSAYAEQRAAIQQLIAYYEQLVQEIYAAIAAQAAMDAATSSSSSSSSIDYSKDYSALMSQAYAAGDMELYEYYKQMRDEKVNAGYSDYGVDTDWIDQYLKDNGVPDGYWTDIDWDKYLNGGYASGGYTGSWGPEGKLTMLHEKELVLNADDTVNFLKGIDIIRSIADSIDLKALQDQVSILPYNPGAQVQSNSDMLEQNVHIEANFPNVQDRNEIQEAFNTLINKASQYANRK